MKHIRRILLFVGSYVFLVILFMSAPFFLWLTWRGNKKREEELKRLRNE